MTKIKVTPEGRDGVWLPEKESLKAWIVDMNFDSIHNFVASGPMMIGANHEVESVLDDIDRGERLAVMTGETRRQNMNHALAIITNEKLEVYDIGELTEEDLEVQP